MKKGFTLIELLAVIVILAIIALIAVPIVLNIINDSKESATLRSAEFYLDAVKLGVAKYKLSNSELIDGIYVVNEKGNLCKETDGTTCENEIPIDVKNQTPNLGSKIEIKNGMINYENTLLKLDNYSCFKEDKFKCLKGNLEIISSTNNEIKINTTNQKKSLYNYLIFGNSIQDEISISETSIGIESVGDKTKNLFDGKWFLYEGNDDWILGSGGYRRRYVQLKPNTTYTINSYIPTGTENVPILFIAEYKEFLDNGQANGNWASTVGTRKATFTTDETGLIILKRTIYNISDDQKIIDLFNNPNVEIQLEEGATVTDYEPYGYKIPVKISGKNISVENRTAGVLPTTSYQPTAEKLFEEDKFYRGIASSGYYAENNYDNKATFENGVYTVYGGGYGVGLPVKVKPNTTYSISFGEKTGEARWTFYDEKGVYIDWNNKTTFTTPENCYWVVITLRPSEEAIFSKIQLEEGSNVTTYEPYKEKIYNIYLDEPLRRVDNYADYIDFANKKIVRNVEVIEGSKLQGLSSPKIENIELPNIELYEDINYLEIDTKVISSKVIIKYYE